MSSSEDNPWTAPDVDPTRRPQPPSDETASASTSGTQTAASVGEEEPTRQHQAATGSPWDAHWQAGNEIPASKQKGGGRRPSWLAAVVVAALVGAIAGSVTTLALGGSDGTVTPAATVAPSRASSAIVTPSTIRGVLDKVQPAVVTIQVNGGQSNGTGMILSPDGEVLTNSHVVSGARDISVTLNGEKQSRPARLLGADPTIDSALVKIDNAANMPTVEFGDSSAVQVGDEVVAIGNALALPGGPSVTSGIISAKDRSIPDPGASFESLIQTDAAINPGNSGGPLANMAGQVVGMNTVVIRGSSGEFENIGFALPSNSLKPVLDDLRAGKKQVPAFLGVSSVTLDATLKERFDLTPDKGAVVSTVSPDSPADEAGLSRFDVITSFDGKDIASSEELLSAVRAKKPGDEVSLIFFRGDQRREVKVTLASRPAL